MKNWWIIPVAIVGVPALLYAGLHVARWFFLTTTADLPPILPL